MGAVRRGSYYDRTRKEGGKEWEGGTCGALLLVEFVCVCVCVCVCGSSNGHPASHPTGPQRAAKRHRCRL